MVYAKQLQHASASFPANIELRDVLEEIQGCEATLHAVSLRWIGREEVDGNDGDD